MAYALENALFQWDEGERHVREAPPRERIDLERAVDAVVEQIRRRLGSAFTLHELAELYAADFDWARDLAEGRSTGADAAYVADAAFRRYAREAANYAGGRARETGGPA